MNVAPGETTFREAVLGGIAAEMERDPRVILIGEDVGAAGGVFQQTAGLFARFGPDRVIDTPISESGFVGIAVGAAMAGMRPVVEIMFGDFLTLGMDQIVNQAAKVHWMSNGQYSVPMVVRVAVGIGGSTGPQHSQSFHVWCAHVPGLKVVFPASPGDAKGLMQAAIRDDNPVIFFEDRMTYGHRGPLREGPVQIGKAAIVRAGSEITLAALGRMVPLALAAAVILEEQGISAEVVDLRSLVPLDLETLATSLRRTHRALVLDPGALSFGAGAEIAASLQETCFDWLDAPVSRMGARDLPVGFAPALEREALPTSADIAARAREMVRGER